jgi:RNA polymerase sigma-70 factor (ECF subfamily)
MAQETSQQSHQHAIHHVVLEDVLRAERDHLVRWCTWLTGDADIAEDLVQETMAVAWRSQHRPSRMEEYPAWLAGIARNRCRSWHRRYHRAAMRTIRAGQQDEPVADLDALLASEPDLEIELEREELAVLLDRALAYLPDDTRAALIWKYIDESPLSEVAARLGVSPGALAARLHRGKLALRQVLATTLRDEAASYGLVSAEDDGWQQTRIWCPACGSQRLVGLLASEHGTFIARCPACFTRTKTDLARWHDPALFGRLTSYRSALSRLSRFGHAYYRRGLAAGAAPCVACGRQATVRLARMEDVLAGSDEIAGILIECVSCRATYRAGLQGLTLCHPEVQRFWRTHPHLKTLPACQVEVAGRSLLLSRFVATAERMQLHVLSDCGTLDVCAIEEHAEHV